MNKDVARETSAERGFRNSGVRTAKPKNLRLLGLGESREKGGMSLGGFSGPRFVGAQDSGDSGVRLVMIVVT